MRDRLRVYTARDADGRAWVAVAAHNLAQAIPFLRAGARDIGLDGFGVDRWSDVPFRPMRRNGRPVTVEREMPGQIEDDRTLREIGFSQEIGDMGCVTCGLHPFESIPESALNDDDECGECSGEVRDA